MKPNGGVRALRLEPDGTGSGAPNVIGGSPVNYVANGIVGAMIAGGVSLDIGPVPLRKRVGEAMVQRTEIKR